MSYAGTVLSGLSVIQKCCNSFKICSSGSRTTVLVSVRD